jgi:hypothetical protein
LARQAIKGWLATIITDQIGKAGQHIYIYIYIYIYICFLIDLAYMPPHQLYISHECIYAYASIDDRCFM